MSLNSQLDVSSEISWHSDPNMKIILQTSVVVVVVVGVDGTMRWMETC